MIIDRLLKISLVLLSIAYVFFEIRKDGIFSDITSAVLVSLLTLLYIRTTKIRKPYMLLFFISYSFSKIMAIQFDEIFINQLYYQYYICNFLFMLAYFFLILRCLITWDFKKIIKQFPATLLVLIMLGVFCVTLITDTAKAQLTPSQYILELIYNIVIMLLLSVALINYMYLDDKKSILFFIGTMFIFLSEMLQLAYYYVSDIPQVAAIYSVFIVLAFAFLYLQSRLKHQKLEFDYLKT